MRFQLDSGRQRRGPGALREIVGRLQQDADGVFYLLFRDQDEVIE